MAFAKYLLTRRSSLNGGWLGFRSYKKQKSHPTSLPCTQAHTHATAHNNTHQHIPSFNPCIDVGSISRPSISVSFSFTHTQKHTLRNKTERHTPTTTTHPLQAHSWVMRSARRQWTTMNGPVKSTKTPNQKAYPVPLSSPAWIEFKQPFLPTFIEEDARHPMPSS